MSMLIFDDDFNLFYKALASDDTTVKLIGIFIHHRLSPGGTNPVLYQNHVNVCLRNTLEEVYRLQVCFFLDFNTFF